MIDREYAGKLPAMNLGQLLAELTAEAGIENGELETADRRRRAVLRIDAITAEVQDRLKLSERARVYIERVVVALERNGNLDAEELAAAHAEVDAIFDALTGWTQAVTEATSLLERGARSFLSHFDGPFGVAATDEDVPGIRALRAGIARIDELEANPPTWAKLGEVQS